jgi:NADH-quinone oxidoreductase subunit E
MFNLAPVGEHHIQLCGTTPCWLRGYDGLAEVLERRIGPKGSVSKDGKLSWLEVECLGACANAPMAQISNQAGHDYYEDMTPQGLEAMLDALEADKPIKAGPQNSRHTSEPEGGALTLNSKLSQDWETLPNAGKKTRLNYYNPDPKERRATRGGWVDPELKASRDPKKRPEPIGKDLTAGLVEKPLKAARPKRSSVKKKPKIIYKDGPTDGAPDDLKRIKGIGPKFEKDLHSKGIYYFRQIAAWKAADVKMVEELIDSIPGRIKRDAWVKQAKSLAKGA